MTPLERALATVDIPSLWRALGCPGEPAPSCCSPFRDDRSPSLSIFDGGRAWYDHATKEGGGAVEFVAAATNSTKTEAARWLIRYARTGDTPGRIKLAPRSERKKPPPAARVAMELPIAPSGGTYGEVMQLQRLRKLPFSAGIEILIDRGILQFCDYVQGCFKHRCWLAIEGTQNGQVRKLDGRHFTAGETTTKAKTLKGATASIPIGTADARSREIVLFCEGVPDMLAAASAAWWELDGQLDQVAVICMLGAGLNINETALPAFAGKRVRIYRHADDAGRKAAAAWCRQLQRAGAVVDQWESEREGEDLNDYVSRAFNPNLPALPDPITINLKTNANHSTNA